MRNPHAQIHLFVRRSDRDDGVAPRWDDEPLIVERGRVLHLDGDARPGDATVASIAIQIVPTALTPRIAVECLRGCRLLMNGMRAPSLATARAGDEIASADAHGRPWRLHVGVYRPAVIGPAGEQLSGRECPLCLGRFSSETHVFRCGCGSALHVAETAGAAGELDCARAVAQCPDCRRTIVLVSGYEELPRDDNGREILPAHRAAPDAANV